MSSTTVRGPVIGKGPSQKGKPRVDFDMQKFIDQVEGHGIRFSWARGTPCPCESANKQKTGAARPTCPRCGGGSFRWFRPADYVIDQELAGEIDTLQQKILNDGNGVTINGVVTGFERSEEAFDQLGEWVFGSFKVTVRPENRVGYYDRLVALDACLPYAQITRTGESVTSPVAVPTRYPVIRVNFFSADQDEPYAEGVDFEVLDTGVVQFLPGKQPDKNTKLTIHYDHHPVLIVWQQLHAFRDTKVLAQLTNTKTPDGNPQPLLLQCLARLEFLMDNNG